MAIRPGGNGDVTASRVVWKRSRGGPYIPTGVVYRNRLFVLADSGRLTCFDAGDGREIWQTKFRGTFTASLIAADGRIYATSESGVVYVVAAADTFELLAQNEMDARCLATPAVADGDLLIRTEGELYCIAGQRDDHALVANSATGAPMSATGAASAPATSPADDPAAGPAALPQPLLPTTCQRARQQTCRG